MTFLRAAKAVLEEMKQPMHFKKITELAFQKGYLETKGKTPEWTMGARLSVNIKKLGRSSDFIRIGNGRYGLRIWKREKRSVTAHVAEEQDHRYWLVSVEPENFRADLNSNRIDTIGVKARMLRTLASLSPGDPVVLYLKRVAAFAAILEVAGSPFTDDSERWPKVAGELSARIAGKPVLVLSEDKLLDARPLYSVLEVFNRYPAKHRTLALRNGITEICRMDYEKIRDSMNKLSGK